MGLFKAVYLHLLGRERKFWENETSQDEAVLSRVGVLGVLITILDCHQNLASWDALSALNATKQLKKYEVIGKEVFTTGRNC